MDGVMAADCNGSWHDVPFQGLEQVADHVHVEDLARHQLAQESNLAQAAVAALKAWRRRSGKWRHGRAKAGLMRRQNDRRAGGGVEKRAA